MKRIALTKAFAAALLALCAAPLGSCSSGDGTDTARAMRVSSRTQLIGGPTALGEVGDYLLENGKVRMIVQDKTYNRGSGVFGGSLIDADLVRYDDEGNALGGSGDDSFGELFPAFFLEMIDPDEVVVVADGSDGGDAIVEVRGRGGEFITMLRYLNQLMLGSYKEPNELIADIVAGRPPDSDTEPQLLFATRFILSPGVRHVRIESSVRNVGTLVRELPPRAVLQALAGIAGIDLGDFRLPMGHVLGFGKRSHVFLPGLGYDIEVGLIESLKEPVPLPAFPGFLTPVVASTNSHGTNYGFISVEDPESNFVYQRDQTGAYGGRARPDDMLYLFNASGFGGVFATQAPTQLAPQYCMTDQDRQSVCASQFPDDVQLCLNRWDGCVEANNTSASEFKFTSYFIIGDGDVASIMEEMYRIRGREVHEVRGSVRDQVTGSLVGERETVLFYVDNSGSCTDVSIVNQVFTWDDGHFALDLPPGRYCARNQGEGRPLGDFVPFEVQGDSTPFVNVVAKSGGLIVARTTAEDGTPLPAKMTVVGTHEYVEGSRYREFLYDEVAGEDHRPTDFVPDDPSDPQTRRFIENMTYGGADGLTELYVPPGTWQVVLSHGAEYSTSTHEVTVEPGGTVRVSAALEHVVDTTGYLSGDFHMHAFGSIDSGLDYNRRVRSVASEGVEAIVSTEHNFVADYQPYILRNDLNRWLTGIVGLELTTFEAGHFNSFPVRREITEMNRGSFAWQEITPKQVFAELRDMAPEGQQNIIQVNHPRTPIMGYFEQHNVDPFTAVAELPINISSGGFSVAGIASPSGNTFIERVELADGKVEYKSTFSWDFDAIEVFNGPHIEELRHFRMRFDKTAPAGDPDALPQETFDGFKANTLDGLDDADINELLAEFLTTETTTVTEDDVAGMMPAARLAAIDDYVLSLIPNQWDVVCNGDEILKAGGLDDWYNLLNTRRPDGSYRKYTATGNSDSHSDHLDEPGFPRNYFYVGHDNPERLSGPQLVDALQKHHNIVSNGPFVNFTVNGEPMGSEISATGSVRVNVTIAAPDWIGADRFRIVANGQPVLGLGNGQVEDFWGWVPITLANGVYEGSFDVPVSRDTWFVIEVESDRNLFPVVHPQEIPPFNFSDVVGNLASSFGLGGEVAGLAPQFTFPVTGFAFTNPVWVVADGDGTFDPSEPGAGSCVEGVYTTAGASFAIDAEDRRRLKTAQVPLPAGAGDFDWLQRPKGETRDLRLIFDAWGHRH